MGIPRRQVTPQQGPSPHRRPTRQNGRRAVAALTAVIAIAGLAAHASAEPAPTNPSDGDLGAAGAQVNSQLGHIGGLINQVATADQRLSQLEGDVAEKREQVNKALVDLQRARTAADGAEAAVRNTQQAAAAAAQQIASAQRGYDDYAVRTYQQGSSTSPLRGYLGARDSAGMLDRVQVLGLLAPSQQAALDGMQRARTEQANKNSAARKAKGEADATAAAAQRQKTSAEHAISSAQQALAAQTARRASLVSERAAAQSKLDAARATVTTLHGQRQAFVAWDQRRRAEEATIAALTATAKQFALQAAIRVANNQAARDRAAALAQGRRPHAQLDDDTGTRSRGDGDQDIRQQPTLTGSAAVETVIDRAMSQLGVTYAWGGGNHNGPTLGIKDGGVADRHGDYKKVGFDCSGLMVYAFAGIGISLPHYSGYQYTAGKRYPSGQMKRGDMLFWGRNGSAHVALYLGNGQMVEAPQSGDVVKVSPVRYSGLMPYVVRMVA